MTSYEKGFITKCAEYGIDGQQLLYKIAGAKLLTAPLKSPYIKKGISKSLKQILASLGIATAGTAAVAAATRGGDNSNKKPLETLSDPPLSVSSPTNTKTDLQQQSSLKSLLGTLSDLPLYTKILLGTGAVGGVGGLTYLLANRNKKKRKSNKNNDNE